MIEQLYAQGWQAQQTGNFALAENSFRRILEVQPGLAQVSLALGNALLSQHRHDEALAAFKNAIRDAGANAPIRAVAACNLGTLYRNLGHLERAEQYLRESLQCLPTQALIWSNLADVCFQTARIEEALAHVATARHFDPQFPMYASNQLYYLQYDPATDARRMRAALDQWRTQLADPCRTAPQAWPNDRTPERRLRIGYVSPDFRDHCQAHFTIPLLTHHDRAQVEIVCYSDATPDRVTARLQPLADLWRPTAGRSDQDLAAMIRADAIDILVDLTMHMAGNRLLVFARRPAPVQVTWLAYPGSTGLDVIDYRLTDPHLDPPGCDQTPYVEKSWRLPATFWCHDPLEPQPPAVGPLPALRRGYVTFGCLNNFCKINTPTLERWAAILRALPTSHLILLSDPGPHCARTAQLLDQLGIAPQRLHFEPRRAYRAYLELFQQVDISLDTLPYNGHTTSLDSYFMGVPVVTLVGPTVVGRAGLSQLTNLGMPELIAHTPEQFVQIAVDLARDLPRLAHLRAGLRQRMQRSPLMDAPAFARAIESAFRQMWRQWCATAS